ncbi:FAD-linked oxidase [Streptomyces lucensis JCM 4490]|uniref:FAD-linked oxidase n=1 Tax=Streptomyces lucensis JCM 4490 TaxID=1306176 RepID=A0A918J8J9_9ACTN|nr:FAD-linked oxidase C-terminal domain-containing protein [Streptomyces lucensis]GGW57230.1 FAD-linked oxidase [Streptomyces lucensis JCM 4490]
MTEVVADVAAALAAALPGRVVTDRHAMEAYRRDQCLLAPAGRPAAVVRARSTDDVITTLRTAGDHHAPVVTRGAGTGLAGAANAIDDCVVLSLTGMDRILSLDVPGRTAIVEPGVLTGVLDARAREHGLWYPPDPGSKAISTIGGNLATNAGGMCCAKYGVTADHVAALTAVLADGRVIRTGPPTRKNVTGLDLTRLLVGSEGTLAVIVDATVRLRPLPAATATAVAAFPTPQQAVDSVLRIAAVADPAAVELMDRTCIRAVNRLTRMGLDESSGALLLVQCDGPSADQEAATCARLAEAGGATEVLHTADPTEGEMFMQARRMVYPALERLGTTLLDDVGVAVQDLPRLLAAIERTAADHGVLVGTFGHAADGNLHPTVVYDATDRDAADRARAAFDDIVAAALVLGGTITGEHGVGSLKTPYLDAQLGPTERELMTGIKGVFDPGGILNPGRGY